MTAASSFRDHVYFLSTLPSCYNVLLNHYIVLGLKQKRLVLKQSTAVKLSINALDDRNIGLDREQTLKVIQFKNVDVL